MILKPVRRARYLLPLIGAAALLPVVVGLADRNYLLWPAGLLLLAEVARIVLITTRGYTESGPHRLTNRLAVRQVIVGWDEVERLNLVPTIFGGYVQVVCRDDRRITLAAPRSGLVFQPADRDAELAGLLAQAPDAHRPRLTAEPPLPALITQGVLLALFAGIGLYVLLHVLFSL